MNSLRVLLVESDETRAGDLFSALMTVDHSPHLVEDLEQAKEALNVQTFDVVLFSSQHSSGSLAAFRRFVQDLAAKSRSGLPAVLVSCAHSDERCSSVDAQVPPNFEWSRLAEIAAQSHSSTPLPIEDRGSSPKLSVFEASSFEDQCASETQLMVEIIDLFFEERDRELREMYEALERGDFERLGKLAHTIKGSLAALHTPAARQQSQTLELAAAARNPVRCGEVLAALDEDLKEVTGALEAFREACLKR